MLIASRKAMRADVEPTSMLVGPPSPRAVLLPPAEAEPELVEQEREGGECDVHTPDRKPVDELLETCRRLPPLLSASVPCARSLQCCVRARAATDLLHQAPLDPTKQSVVAPSSGRPRPWAASWRTATTAPTPKTPAMRPGSHPRSSTGETGPANSADGCSPMPQTRRDEATWRSLSAFPARCAPPQRSAR